MTTRRLFSVLRWALYALVFLLAMMVQTVVLSRGIHGFFVSCVPLAVACVSMQEGAEGGGAFALAAAFLWCLSGADYGSAQIVTLTVCRRPGVARGRGGCATGRGFCCGCTSARPAGRRRRRICCRRSGSVFAFFRFFTCRRISSRGSAAGRARNVPFGGFSWNDAFGFASACC